MENQKQTDSEPYAVLAREHRLIERGLDVLGRLCDGVRRTKQLDVPAALEVIHFLRDFADRTHHLKEERILFPAIDRKTFFPGCGLISEHKEGRERVGGMAAWALRTAGKSTFSSMPMCFSKPPRNSVNGRRSTLPGAPVARPSKAPGTPSARRE